MLTQDLFPAFSNCDWGDWVNVMLTWHLFKLLSFFLDVSSQRDCDLIPFEPGLSWFFIQHDVELNFFCFLGFVVLQSTWCWVFFFVNSLICQPLFLFIESTWCPLVFLYRYTSHGRLLFLARLRGRNCLVLYVWCYSSSVSHHFLASIKQELLLNYVRQEMFLNRFLSLILAKKSKSTNFPKGPVFKLFFF